jgi:hypothetical protein
VLHCLSECQRVMKSGAPLTIVVPYYSSQLYAQDQDHRTPYTERTWERIFNNGYYDRVTPAIQWKFWVHSCVVMATEERNTALVTQLVRVP